MRSRPSSVSRQSTTVVVLAAMLLLPASCTSDDTITDPNSLAPSILITLTDQSLSIAIGESAETGVKITRTNFGGAVSLSVSGVPTGVTASISPPTLGSDSATLEITSVASATPGTYQLVVTAQAPGIATRTATLQLTLTSGTAAAFTASHVSVGANHTCAITTTGAAYCWGRGTEFAIGDGEGSDRTRPTAVSGGLTFSRIAAGSGYTCGVSDTGTGYCWGSNNAAGRLGDGTSLNRLQPAEVAGSLTFRHIRPAGNATCGLTATNKVYCWGSLNFLGPVPDASTEPIEAAGGVTFDSVSYGSQHACGLTAGDSVQCWGVGTFGQLGRANPTSGYEPIPVDGGHTFRSVASGNMHSCALNDTGKVYCWGWNASGQIGDGTTGDRLVPTAVAPTLTFTKIFAGGNITCALTQTGQAYCWGQGPIGVDPNDPGPQRTTPTQVAPGIAFSHLALGQAHACGITTASALYCWGGNSFGQLGEGTTTFRPLPTVVPALAGNFVP